MNPPLSANDVIAQLGLQPLPQEGGFFARTWTSAETLPGGRPLGTAIYFLLTPTGFSALHRLDADEIWYFHTGDPVEHVQLSPNAPDSLRVTTLGADFASGQVPQLSVPAGSWQGARLSSTSHHGWALVSCSMSPGWTDACFELVTRSQLTALFPSHAAGISELIRAD